MADHIDNDDRDNFAAFAKAIEANPDDHHPYVSRGLLYEELGMHDRAIADFTKFMELTGPNFIYAYKRGVLYRLTRRYQQAIDDFTWMLDDIALDASDTFRCSALKYRAEALLHIGKPHEALADIDRALPMIPVATDKHTDALATRALIEKALAALPR